MLKNYTVDFLENRKPKCMVCNKLVDKIELFNDWSTERHYTVVYCHGDSDIEDFPNDLIKKYGISNIMSGECFNKRRLVDERKKELDQRCNQT